MTRSSVGTDRHFQNPLLRMSSPEERESRYGRLRDMMQDEGVDVMVVVGRDDIRYRGRTAYVSDYWQLLSDAFVIVPMKGNPIFVGHPVLGTAQAEQSDWPSDFRTAGQPGEETAQILRDLGHAAGEVGVVGMADALSHAHYLEMTETIPDANLRDLTRQFDAVRQVKSDEELANHRETSAIFAQMFKDLEPSIRPGVTEIDLVAEAHQISREYGCRSSMVLVGSPPFGAPAFGTMREIAKDGLVMVWIEGPGPSGAWLEARQLYRLGPLSSETQDFWDLHVESVTAGIAALKPGAMASDFVKTTGEGMAAGGWPVETNPDEQHHTYNLHGIGHDAIEGVWVPGNDRACQENEIVNVHCWVDFADPADGDKLGFVGVTDNVLVTPDGGQFMTWDTPTINEL